MLFSAGFNGACVYACNALIFFLFRDSIEEKSESLTKITHTLILVGESKSIGPQR